MFMKFITNGNMDVPQNFAQISDISSKFVQ